MGGCVAYEIWSSYLCSKPCFSTAFFISPCAATPLSSLRPYLPPPLAAIFAHLSHLNLLFHPRCITMMESECAVLLLKT